MDVYIAYFFFGTKRTPPKHKFRVLSRARALSVPLDNESNWIKGIDDVVDGVNVITV